MLSTTNVKYGVELPVFLIFFAVLLGTPIEGNFVIYRTCYVLMGRNESDCAKLGIDTDDNATRELETEVQEVANYLSIILEILGSIIPCILCLFIGPYSDKTGRKNILIVTLTGIVISAGVRSIIALLPNLSPWYLAIQAIPTALTGGMPAFISVAFCYLIDVTGTDNRSMRIGLQEGALSFGMISGLFFSSYVFTWIGYVGTFILCFCLLLMALCFVVLCVPESIEINKKEEVKFFTFVHLQNMWHTTFKSREGYNRTVLLGGICAIVFFVAADASTGTESLLMRSKFHWDLTSLTNFASIQSVVAIIVMCVSIYVFHNLLKVPESALIALGSGASAIATAIFAFAEYNWQIYAAAGVGMFFAIISPMIRSLLSNIIPREETGKVLSFCISIESFCSLFAGPLYTVIYTETIDVFPGAFDLIPCAIYMGITFYFIYVYILTKRPNAVIYLEQNAENLKSQKNNVHEMVENGIKT